MTDNLATPESLKELLKIIQSDNHGLPNLPALATYWDCKEIIVVPLPGIWNKIVDSDPSRWYLQISSQTGTVFNYTTIPNDTGLGGSVATGGIKEWKYKDIGPWMQQDIYCTGPFDGSSFTAIMSSIRLKGPQ